jgi:ribosomal protein L22
MSKRYQVIYIYRELEQENDTILVEAIAIEEEHIKKVFKNRIEKLKYIDYLTPQFLIFKEFYHITNIKPKIDAFVYLDEDTSFVAIYKDGEYLYSKSLNPLNLLLKQLNMSYKEFIELAQTKGLDKDSYEENELEKSELIDRFFSEFFMKINNILMYGRSVFYIDSIDRIYFYTPFKIKNIDTFNDFWNLSGVEFNELVIDENIKINQIDLLGLYYVKNNSDINQYNFKIFNRPPPFYKTEFGKYSIFVFLVLSLFGADYYYRMSVENKLNSDISKLKTILNKKETKARKEKIKLQALEKKYNHLLKIKSGIRDNIKFFTESVKLANKIINKPKVSNDFVLFSKLLKLNHLRTLSIDENETKIVISVYTNKNNRKNIGRFMNDLLSNGFKNVETNEILLKDNLYISEVGVSR